MWVFPRIPRNLDKEGYLSNMTKKPSVVSVGTKDSSAALPRWSQKGRDSLSMIGQDSIFTHRFGSPVSKSKACSSSSSSSTQYDFNPAQRSPEREHLPIMKGPGHTMFALEQEQHWPSSTAQSSTAQSSTAQSSTAHQAPCGTAQHSTAQHGTARHGTAQHILQESQDRGQHRTGVASLVL